jgi:hypothetical protein
MPVAAREEVEGFELLEEWMALERRDFKDRLASLSSWSRQLRGQADAQRAVNEAAKTLDELYGRARS